MTHEEFAFSWHETQLLLQLYQRIGRSFQDFFEMIMQKHDPSFVLVKPMGRAGDWKADGFSLQTGTIFQCYAPEEMTGSEAAKKVIEDFDGAAKHWAEKMRAWVFVWSSESALPPQVVAALAQLKADNPNILINHVGREGLWQIVKGLRLQDRVAILGPVPELSVAPTTSAVEISTLLNYLRKNTEWHGDDSDFDLTGITQKLERNRLSGAVVNIVRPATPVARLVREYVTRMPDPDFSQVIAAELVDRYNSLARSTHNPDVIFSSLVDYVLGEQRLDPKFYWAAVGIVTYYFELCEVFQR